ncbi:conserved hypothetical protein [Enterobacterales bacterium 8AC]|nr:conserved hypothetical protein [Enterobacterales bacterium 8AC]
MSSKIVSNGRLVDSVAYDIALAIASKDAGVSTPEALLAKISELLPECTRLVSAKDAEESPPVGGVNVKFRI